MTVFLATETKQREFRHYPTQQVGNRDDILEGWPTSEEVKQAMSNKKLDQQLDSKLLEITIKFKALKLSTSHESTKNSTNAEGEN